MTARVDFRAALAEAGVLACPNVARDPRYWAAIGAGALYWGWLAATDTRGGPPLTPVAFLLLACWQPLVEELLFRGVLQGLLRRPGWGRRAWLGFSVANGVAALLFALAHLWNRAPGTALPLLLPALLYGYFRDRHRSVWPAVLLHAVYNAGYFLVLRGLGAP